MSLQTPDNFVPDQVGNKAWNLKRLHDAGYAVPPFVVLPATTVRELTTSATSLPEICSHIQRELGTENSLAIRSSACSEDTAGSAQAGQFHTALPITSNELATALPDCIHHPKNYPAASRGDLALIIQTYLTPHQQGVLFTRQPQGKQSMVVEYSKRGSVVSGEAATHVTYHPHDPPSLPELPHLSALTKIGSELEAAWDWPQDIEWLEHNDQLYILQARAITSIRAAAWHGLQVAERTLANHTAPYYYQQTPLTEQFTHPRPLTVSLLQTMYEADGPVAAAYRTAGITYHPKMIHHTLAGTLYIDREAELQTIFPALSMYTSSFGRPRWATWHGSGTTLKNFLASTLLRTSHTSDLRQRLEAALQAPLPPSSTPAERWQTFLAIYPLIYEVSLRTQKALSLLPRDQNVPAGPIDHTPLNPHDYGLSHEQTIGNSLSLDDTSPFTFHFPTTDTITANPTAREMLRIRARTYLTLREYSRWLTVKHLHHLRHDLNTYAANHLPRAPDLIFYATWEELLTQQLDQSTLETRASEHEATQALTPPALLTSHTLTTINTPTAGLAPGTAGGRVCTADNLSRTASANQILYTKTLYPELTELFPYLQGIITAEGGVLSHLAIMAREHGLPVIKSAVPYEQLSERVVEIDGNTGALYTEEGADIKS